LALSADRLGELRQAHFLEIVKRIPELVDASYLRQCGQQIQIALLDAECGATFALTMGDGTEQDILNLISNGLKNYRLSLPRDVKQVILSLADITEKADSEQANLLKETIRALTPSTLCGWILVDALRKKDFQLLKAACTLGIDSLAIDSFAISLPKKRKLEDLPEAIGCLF
jgi:hypothetical protein